MDGIPGDLYGRVQSALLRCGPFDSDLTLRSLFVDARLSAWRDFLPEVSNRAGRAQAVIGALSRRANPAGENALVLLLRVLAENTPAGDACHDQLMALAQEVAAVARVDATSGGVSPAHPSAGSTVFNQQGWQVGTQVNVAGDYYAQPTQPPVTIIGDKNIVGKNNVVQVDRGAEATSSTATSPVNVSALRALLQRFDAVEIESLCLDHFPEVYDKFTRGLQRGEMINLLLDHCRRHPLDAARLAELV